MKRIIVVYSAKNREGKWYDVNYETVYAGDDESWQSIYDYANQVKALHNRCAKTWLEDKWEGITIIDSQNLTPEKFDF